MLVHLAALLLQAAPSAPQPTSQATTPPSAAPERDSTAHRHRDRKAPKRIEVTPAHLASAFRDPGARAILLVARAARERQDSALLAYDATTYQRVSAGVGFSRFGRDRLAFRSEGATRVRWRRGVGAYVDVTGSRTVVPIAGKSAHVDIEGSLSPIPYYPGSETLWIGASAARRAVDENEEIIHPLAEGAEAYYTYASGDSAAFRMPDGRSIRLRELKIRPRTPRWNLAVGSLWFDMSGGQLVRAAYRMSVPMDIEAVAREDDSTAFDDVPRVMKPMLFPMKAEISAVGVEYGLYQGRFWLPRVQIAQGGAQVGFLRIPFKLEQKFTYDHVNAGAPLPPMPALADSAREAVSVSVEVDEGMGKAARDSARAARRAARERCDSTGVRRRVRHRDGMSNPVVVVIPCDSTRLATSPDLPKSIYDSGDETVQSSEIDALVSEALAMGAQSGFAPAPITLAYAPIRYNRVEGLSVGGIADQQLGAGYSVHALARIGVADREPNVELTGARSDLRRTLGVTVYNRLVSASDWGNPLGTGASISAFLFGRDEGLYYRASGVELSRVPDQRGPLNVTVSLFAEQERDARQRTTFSLARAMHGSQFEPNIRTERALWAGARLRATQSIGEDPQGFRLFNDLRLETAHGDTGTYGRMALDATLSHGIGDGAAALTLAGGTSAGTLPLQRNWFLGGTQTVRGQRPGIAFGDAFWLARAEVAHGVGAVRPVLFGDIGWAGDRTNWSNIGRPISGAGAGISVLDGLLRFDVARGIQPEKQWRVDMYVEGRF
ncbi:MAG TPA: ShlB/FhaC/HecB family hemolysin secretion/activation protein [Gemmatimonadaceae bacterium]|nr:ShlB/FhaC/HecB family hemolysin secretion/activation protein [Gemmatimonadaceae bacterium]